MGAKLDESSNLTELRDTKMTSVNLVVETIKDQKEEDFDMDQEFEPTKNPNEENQQDWIGY